jgi:hypothetical protein
MLKLFINSILKSFNKDEQDQLQKFIQTILNEKIINEI